MMETAPNEPLVFTGHENLCIAIEAALQTFTSWGCRIRRRPWNKGMHRIAVDIPADVDGDLRDKIKAEADRASIAYYEDVSA